MMELQISYSKCLICIQIILLVIRGIESDVSNFDCKKDKDGPLPTFPKAFSTNVRINYLFQYQTVEIREVYNSESKKYAFEVWAGTRHTKYIILGEEDVLLVINYLPNAHPVCKVKKKPQSGEMFFEAQDAGPGDILHKVVTAVANGTGFKPLDEEVNIDRVSGHQWAACLDDLKILITFATPTLNPSRRKKDPDVWELIKLEAMLGTSTELTALYSSFDTSIPDNSEFQPPEDVYCEGFRTGKKLPPLPQYFSYQSELVVYETSQGIAPVVSHRTVYYDYPSGITRIDLQDALADNPNMFSPVTAQMKSIIHDYNSGVQYSFDPITGKCKVDEFEATFTAVSAKETVKNDMLTTSQYFLLDDVKLSYNGQYSTRGLNVDVYSGVVKNDKETRIFHWYFSTDRTQLVENESVEKNVLLRILSRPQTSNGKEGQLEINFYNFVQAEPSVFAYDLTSCYDISQYKAMVLTFPVDSRLIGLGTMIKGPVHQAVMEATGISMQRIYVKEVAITTSYIFVEFKIMDKPPLVGKTAKPSTEPTLSEALDKLKKSVEDEKFSVTIKLEDNVGVKLIPPKQNGLNEFYGRRKPSEDGYKEASVIGLTVGMLFLGFVLGAVAINLVISKKFGVSLFQKSGLGKNSFDNPLNESSM